MNPEEADRIIRLIKGEIEEPDDYSEMTEEQIIAAEKKRKPEPKEPEEYGKMLPHSMDSHSSGSFVYTPKGEGVWPFENTLTRFTEKRKPR